MNRRIINYYFTENDLLVSLKYLNYGPFERYKY